MSNALALAAVSAVLKDLLDNALIDHSVSAAVGATVTVSAQPPDRIETGDNEEAQLNLFLYQVSPNAALRNADLPTRNGRGNAVARPVLALDLHYLLSAYGAEDFQAEILLGYGMQLLHERPVLTRDAIRATLASPSPVDGSILPPALSALSAAALAEQLESVKITPVTMNTEEISKLWTAFQAKYRPSAAYVATVVLIESEVATRGALPVLTRGPVDEETGRERGVVAQASLEPPFPAVLSVAPATAREAVHMGEMLQVRGRRLDEGDTIVARFTHVRSGDVLELEPEPGGDAAGFDVALPPDPAPGPVTPGSPQDPASWLAGVYALSIVLRRADGTERVTNALPVVLAPRISNPAAAAAGAGVVISVDVSPPVRATQSVRLLVGTTEAPVDPIAGPSATTLEFTADFPTGEQWLRLRVDEASSLLVDRTAVPPVFDPSQRVVVP